MASSSSLALSFSSSSLSQNWEHDVFPSFHGPDVRKTFLSHVLKEFRRKGISLFIDNEITRGKSIGPELIRAIRGSKIAMVLLSKNYASSSWCLNELVEITKRELGQTVITIFYEVDPTDVKKQTGDFGKAFEETCRGKTEEQIESWRKALEGVSTIAGYHSRNWNDDAAMIEKISADISKMINHLTPSCDFDHFIGMETHMEKMKLLLRLDLDEVRMIGIWGPPGIGKTTIARILFNQVSSGFLNSAFMENIKGSYPRRCFDGYTTQLQLQNQMLSLLTNHKDIVIPHLGVAQGRLRDKKVFLVLDDVDRSEQLDALAKNDQWFGSGSRIIITTQNLKLLKAHGISLTYKVEFPSVDKALHLFCMYAFGQRTPKDGFAEFAYGISHLVGKLPLGLQVMGSHFRGLLSKQEWSMEVERLRANIDGEIESILKFSYDALCDEDKYLFLHIACLFNFEYMEKVEAYLEESFKNVRQRLHVLAEKSLISINGYVVRMHTLLVQLGKEIVRKQSVREPGQRQFLVDNKDTCAVLTDYRAITRSVVGIYYNEALHITEKAFERMSNLQFLRVGSYNGYLNFISAKGPLHYISPKLRLLNWSHGQMTSLPFIINLEFLVELKMRYSEIEKLWDGIKLLHNLKWMDLSYSRNLKELPNLSTATNLKELILMRCTSLVELPFSIGNATNLQKLNLSDCSSLVELPSSIGNATNLQKLNLNECSSLVELPSSIGNATNLHYLDLIECSSLVELPSSIGNATNLHYLDLIECSSLVEIPSSIGNLTNLQKLDFSECSSLVELPSSIGNATNLQKLDLSGCKSLVELPSSIGNLHKLQYLDLQWCSKLKALPININMESLNLLDLSYCSSLKSFPEISTNIGVLNLIGTSIREVPSSIRSWTRLEDLWMPYSENLKEFPYIHNRITELHFTDTGIQELGGPRASQRVKGLSSLIELVIKKKNLVSLPQLPDSQLFQEIGPWVSGCSRLEGLVIKGMKNLVSLPQLPDSLKRLDAENCESLERLDCSFCNAHNFLNFGNCFKLNKEARDLIIQTSTLDYAVLPGGEVPACFTCRASGSSVTMKLNQKPLLTSTKFKACILFAKKRGSIAIGGHALDTMQVFCTINSKENSLTAHRSCKRYLDPVLTEHLYIFEFEAKEVTSTELVFEFNHKRKNNWEIKECGILHLLEHHVD